MKRIAILDRMARVVESIYCMPYSAVRLFEKINRLEAEVAASKIAARAQGILGDALPGSSPNDALTKIDLAKIDLIDKRVGTHDSHRRLTPLLEDLLREAEEKLSERKLTSQAKALIQRTYGMSQEQAYAHLRNASRRSRRPLSEVARELIAEAARPA